MSPSTVPLAHDLHTRIRLPTHTSFDLPVSSTNCIQLTHRHSRWELCLPLFSHETFCSPYTLIDVTMFWCTKHYTYINIFFEYFSMRKSAGGVVLFRGQIFEFINYSFYSWPPFWVGRVSGNHRRPYSTLQGLRRHSKIVSLSKRRNLSARPLIRSTGPYFSRKPFRLSIF